MGREDLGIHGRRGREEGKGREKEKGGAYLGGNNADVQASIEVVGRELSDRSQWSPRVEPFANVSHRQRLIGLQYPGHCSLVKMYKTYDAIKEFEYTGDEKRCFVHTEVARVELIGLTFGVKSGQGDVDL